MSEPPATPPVVEAVNFGVLSRGNVLLAGITLALSPGRILAVIGPTASGKSLFLRCINRLCELDGPVHTTGKMLVCGADVYAPGTDLMALRRNVGMVFSKPSLPVPGIFDNVAMAPRLAGIHDKSVLAGIVERALRHVALWDAVAPRLAAPANALTAEQQQRLCIARVLAADPAVLLFDEPTAHLDYPSAGHIEDLIVTLARAYPVLIAAQTPQQASHVAHDSAFFWQGRLIESGPTEDVLTNPKDPRTEAYVTGRTA